MKLYRGTKVKPKVPGKSSTIEKNWTFPEGRENLQRVSCQKAMKNVRCMWKTNRFSIFFALGEKRLSRAKFFWCACECYQRRGWLLHFLAIVREEGKKHKTWIHVGLVFRKLPLCVVAMFTDGWCEWWWKNKYLNTMGFFINYLLVLSLTITVCLAYCFADFSKGKLWTWRLDITTL